MKSWKALQYPNAIIFFTIAGLNGIVHVNYFFMDNKFLQQKSESFKLLVF